ncbi:MAG: hypothetical protein IJ259_00510 [Oscillospiraceae bacterium]|nr:hypothetical protein [Oscillospiraceae bacterium]
MGKPKLVTVILCGLAATIWTVRAILGVVYQEYRDSVFWFILNVLCAVIWIAAFIKWLKIYRSNTKE